MDPAIPWGTRGHGSSTGLCSSVPSSEGYPISRSLSPVSSFIFLKSILLFWELSSWTPAVQTPESFSLFTLVAYVQKGYILSLQIGDSVLWLYDVALKKKKKSGCYQNLPPACPGYRSSRLFQGIQKFPFVCWPPAYMDSISSHLLALII